MRCRTLPRVRELKHTHLKVQEQQTSRTLPRVRELKPESTDTSVQEVAGRTLPRVRELKLTLDYEFEELNIVAPFPGCVN